MLGCVGLMLFCLLACLLELPCPANVREDARARAGAPENLTSSACWLACVLAGLFACVLCICRVAACMLVLRHVFFSRCAVAWSKSCRNERELIFYKRKYGFRHWPWLVLAGGQLFRYWQTRLHGGLQGLYVREHGGRIPHFTATPLHSLSDCTKELKLNR